MAVNVLKQYEFHDSHISTAGVPVVLDVSQPLLLMFINVSKLLMFLS